MKSPKSDSASGGEFLEISPERFLGAIAAGTLRSEAGGRGIIVRGSVDLRGHALGGAITEMPDAAITGDLAADGGCALRTCRCRVSGSVTLDGSLIEEFNAKPDRVGSVGGKFSARNCPALRRIAGKFRNDVNLDGSGIGAIGGEFECLGSLGVERCMSLRLIDCRAWSVIADGSALEEIGPNAVVENLCAEDCAGLEKAFPVAGLRWAKYDGSGIREVPPEFRCDGPAYFKRCRKLRKLAGHADKFEVSMAPLERVSGVKAGEIILSECPRLPDNMPGTRAKALVFSRCGIEKFPGGIPEDTCVRVGDCRKFSRLPAFWKGDISLYDLPALRGTPRDFRCEGNFDACDCGAMDHLGGKIGGNLWLMDGTGRLRELGDDLEIGGDLTIAGLAGVRRLNCRVGKDVIAGGSRIRETGGSFFAGGDADFHGCADFSVLRGRVGGMAMLDNSSVLSIGADFECGGDLAVRETRNLVSLNCSVGGKVVATDSSLRRTGPAFRCAKSLNVAGCRHFEGGKGEVGGRTRRSAEAGGKAKPLRRSAETHTANRVYPTASFVTPGRAGAGGKRASK